MNNRHIGTDIGIPHILYPITIEVPWKIRRGTPVLVRYVACKAVQVLQQTPHAHAPPRVPVLRAIHSDRSSTGNSISGGFLYYFN